MAVRDGILSFEEGIGNWRMTNKSINFPTNKYKFIQNSLIEIPKIENETIDVVDEWDTKAICKQVEDLNPCMIRAKFAGSGPKKNNPTNPRPSAIHESVFFGFFFVFPQVLDTALRKTKKKTFGPKTVCKP